jgi:hypothetical protein
MRTLTKAVVAASFAIALFVISTDADAHRRHRRLNNDRPAPAIPEPAGALAFGAGLLAVTAAARKRAAR